MKKVLVLLFALCVFASALYVPASAAEETVNSVIAKEALNQAYTVYLGEIEFGNGTFVKYIFSQDAQIGTTSYENLSAALGAFGDDDFSSLLTKHYSGMENGDVGIKKCSEPLFESKMNDSWASAKDVAALYCPGGTAAEEKSGELYDLNEDFRAECDRQEQKRAEDILYPIETDKRIVSSVDVNSVDCVTYTVIDGQIVKIIDTIVTYSVDAATVIYTYVKVEGADSFIRPGDVDNSGSVDSTDYILVKRHILKISELTGGAFAAADMDNSGVLDATDYIAIKRIMLGLA